VNLVEHMIEHTAVSQHRTGWTSVQQALRCAARDTGPASPRTAA
jgi:hypothetical protein